MAYEDLSIAKLAKQKWNSLAQALGRGFVFELRLWKFDALRIPELRDVAVNDAVEAHMILVVTHGEQELPSGVKAWIDQWLARSDQKREAARLLALLADPLSEKSEGAVFSQFAYLQQVARKGSMDFLASTAPILTRLDFPKASTRTQELERGDQPRTVGLHPMEARRSAV